MGVAEGYGGGQGAARTLHAVPGHLGWLGRSRTHPGARNRVIWLESRGLGESYRVGYPDGLPEVTPAWGTKEKVMSYIHARKIANMRTKVVLVGVLILCAIVSSCARVDDTRALKKIGEQISAGRWEDAGLAINNYVYTHPYSIEGKAFQGYMCLRNAEDQKAFNILTDVINKDPHNELACAGLACLALKEQDWHRAIQIALSELERQPNSLYLNSIAAQAYTGLGDEMKAKIFFDRVKSIDPTFAGIPVAGGWDAFVKFVKKNPSQITTFIAALGGLVVSIISGL